MRRIRRKRIEVKLIVSLLVLLFIDACSDNRECLKDYLVFRDFKESPGIAIMEPSGNSECEFKAALFVCIGGHSLQGEGLLLLKNQWISIKLIKPRSKYFQFLNLEAKRGDVYKVVVELDTTFTDSVGLEITVSVEDKLLVSGEQVTIFRVSDFCCYGGELFDQVFFVTRNRGVIGSYISKIDSGKNVEFYISPRGNILEELIDYSKKIKGSLK